VGGWLASLTPPPWIILLNYSGDPATTVGLITVSFSGQALVTLLYTRTAGWLQVRRLDGFLNIAEVKITWQCVIRSDWPGEARHHGDRHWPWPCAFNGAPPSSWVAASG